MTVVITPRRPLAYFTNNLCGWQTSLAQSPSGDQAGSLCSSGDQHSHHPSNVPPALPMDGISYHAIINAEQSAPMKSPLIRLYPSLTLYLGESSDNGKEQRPFSTSAFSNL